MRLLVQMLRGSVMIRRHVGRSCDAVGYLVRAAEVVASDGIA